MPSSSYDSPSSPNPNHKPTSPLRRHTPQTPIYYYPKNPKPFSHFTSRPKPRPGFVKRILKIIDSRIQSFMRLSKKTTVQAGLIMIVSVLGAAGWAMIFERPRKLVSGKMAGTNRVIERNIGGEKIWGWGLDEFVGFNGSKGGPLDGLLKVFQMWT